MVSSIPLGVSIFISFNFLFIKRVIAAALAAAAAQEPVVYPHLNFFHHNLHINLA